MGRAGAPPTGGVAGSRERGAGAAPARGPPLATWGGGKFGSPTPRVWHYRGLAGGKREPDLLLAGARELLEGGLRLGAGEETEAECGTRIGLLVY